MKSLLLAVMLTACALARAADPSAPHILVAKPEFRDPMYGSTVVVVKPLGGDQHVGFIVNRPTDLRLGKLFPEHGPSQKIAEPVYLGGPMGTQNVFALVQRAQSPGGRSVEIAPGLFAVIDAPLVDRIIEAEAERARFVVGLVVWRPGELAAEIKQGAWYVLESDAKTALRQPQGLWEELVQRSALLGNAI
jgi:putative transcriptional regulator